MRVCYAELDAFYQNLSTCKFRLRGSTLIRKYIMTVMEKFMTLYVFYKSEVEGDVNGVTDNWE